MRDIVGTEPVLSITLVFIRYPGPTGSQLQCGSKRR
jgi:hypothetical protein